jgi:nicotinate phosphoribosyltransferase
MKTRGLRLQGVRIDSGDLAELAVQVRRLLDEAGLPEVKIVGSGGLDEYDLAQFSAANVPYDSYGIGTKMGVSADAPWSDMAYKLVQYGDRPVLKLSTGKESWPGRKQIYRLHNARGQLSEDIIALRTESIAGADALLERVLREGKITAPLPTLKDARNRCREELERLPEIYRSIINPARYPVQFSAGLRELRDSLQKQARQAQ